MKNTKKPKTFVELEGKLDQLTQNELAKIAGGEQSSQESEGDSLYSTTTTCALDYSRIICK